VTELGFFVGAYEKMEVVALYAESDVSVSESLENVEYAEHKLAI
jgi:hypothetical protein